MFEMNIRRRGVFLAASALAIGAPAYAAGGTQVAVTLHDQTDAAGASHMFIEAKPGQIKAGTATFTVHNASKTLTHEMLLLLNDPSGSFPYSQKDQMVIEEKVKKFVDTDDIAPGATVTRTVELAPGNYTMICNQAGHYQMGMKTSFTVVK